MDFWINIGIGIIIGLYVGNRDFRNLINGWIKQLNQKPTTTTRKKS